MDDNRPGIAFKLVVDAIKSLGEERGSTAIEIVKFISTNRTIDDQMVKCIYTTLRRGVDDGCFRENEGRFSLSVHMTPPLLRIKTNRAGGEKKEQALGKELVVKLAKARKCMRRKRSMSKRCSCGKKHPSKRKSRKRSSRGCTRKTRRRSRCKKRQRPLYKPRCSRKRKSRRSVSSKRRTWCRC